MMDFPPEHDLQRLQIGLVVAAVAIFVMAGFITNTRRGWLIGTICSWALLVAYYWACGQNFAS
jgi:hypothetical protein